MKRKKSPKQKLAEKADVLVRKIVQDRDRVCQKCGSPHANQPSHVYSRGDKRLRWDALNILWMCYHCHIHWWHKEPIEATEWFKKKYPDRYRYLQKYRKTTEKRPLNIVDYEKILQTLQELKGKL